MALIVVCAGPTEGESVELGGLGVRFMTVGEVRYARPGDLVVKPRGIAHAFWNRTDEPARLLEIISPGGFERYFAELAPLLPPQRDVPDFEALAALQARYGLTMDMDIAATISEREGLTVPA
jgi:Cupin domain